MFLCVNGLTHFNGAMEIKKLQIKKKKKIFLRLSPQSKKSRNVLLFFWLITEPINSKSKKKNVICFSCIIRLLNSIKNIL